MRKQPFYWLCLILLSARAVFSQQTVNIWATDPNVRENFGVEKLKTALNVAGYKVTLNKSIAKNGYQIVVGLATDPTFQKLTLGQKVTLAASFSKESFELLKQPTSPLFIAGADASGALYGCLELAEQLKKNQRLPQQLSLKDQPEMVLRGTCIGVQKPVYLPGREVYEYPYTPETFPWLYDKMQWIRSLDMMV